MRIESNLYIRIRIESNSYKGITPPSTQP